MKNSTRIAVARAFLPLFIVFQILSMRNSYAFAPVGAAPIVIVGTLAGGAVVPLLVGAAIAGLAYWVAKDLATGDEVRVPARDGAEGAVPAPTPPLGSEYRPPTTNGGCFSNWVGLDRGLLCAGGDYNGTCSGISGTIIEGRCYYQGSYSITWNPQQIPGSCSDGYIVNGATCVIQNPRAAVQDSKQDFTRSGTQLSPIAADKAGGLSGTTMTGTNNSDTVAITGKDSQGNPVQGKIQAQPDGGTIVTVQTQKVTGTGQSYVETQKVRTDGQGNTIESSKTVSSDTLKYNPTTKTYDQLPAPTGTIAPQLDAPVAQPLQLPTDYARQGEAATAAQTIIQSWFGPPGPSDAASGPGSAAQSQQDAITGLCDGPACASSSSLNPGISWLPTLLPGSPVACEPIEFRGAVNVGPAAGLDSTTSLDVCWMLELVRSIFGWLINVVGVVYIWRRFTTMYTGGST